MAKSKKCPQYFAAIATTMGSFAVGASLAWSSPASPRLVAGHEYSFTVNDEQMSWIGSLLPIGAVMAAVPTSGIIAYVGRKWCIVSLIFPFSLGWALIIGAVNRFMMYFGRILLGFCTGAYFIAAPPYIGEISDKDIRGKLGSSFQLMLVVGAFLVYSVGPLLSVQRLSIICGILPFIFAFMLMFVPDSPTYYVRASRDHRAIGSIQWLRGEEYDYGQELAELKEENKRQKEQKPSNFKTLLFRRTNRRALMIGLSLMFFQQATGINILIFYLMDVFDRAKVNIDLDTASVIFGAVQVIGTAFQSLIVDRVGRKILLLISESGLCLANFVLGTYFHFDKHEDSALRNYNWIPVATLSLFIVLFALGMGPVPFVILGEIFGNDIKNCAASTCGMFKWLITFLVAKSFNNLYVTIGMSMTFWIYSGLSLLGVIYFAIYIPETKGKSLAEIQEMLFEAK